ncbi:uncharacterized protein LOC111991750 isoform X3 [Quercus suber]|uniref:uncharacterized protein LOC111991750 isoform X3 n=1 Tax=Quercus suber TaxID=58331 RepID=UPI000CE1DF0D|nr:uncharacterized protein LOC111991750 isoform X2 [Quercus suber]
MANKHAKNPCAFPFAFTLVVVFFTCVLFVNGSESEYVSAVGDPGMRRDGLRLAIESWNQCNEVGEEAPHMGSPRAADCFDIYTASPPAKEQNCSLCNLIPNILVQRVTDKDNNLGVGDPFLGVDPNALSNVDVYAAEKELYLGSKCEVEDTPKPWQFWMIMLKSGNMDTFAAKCPKNGHKVGPFGPDKGFPCFGKGCMNQPTIYHDYTTLQGLNMSTLKGRFYGSWDLDADLSKGLVGNISYHSVTWEKELGKGSSWVFHNVLRTSTKYPWLMLYLRSDATHGLSGGYHYPTRGMSKILITCIAHQEMQSILRHLTVYVIHIAILNLKRYYRFCHTQFGVSMGTLLSKGRVGLGIQGRGNLMLGGCHNHFSFTRIQVLLQQGGNGCLLIWELKYLKTQIKLLNGLLVTSTSLYLRDKGIEAKQ